MLKQIRFVVLNITVAVVHLKKLVELQIWFKIKFVFERENQSINLYL